LLPRLAGAALHEATGVGPVVAVLHEVVVKVLPGAAAADVQEAVGVGPVPVVAQVVAV